MYMETIFAFRNLVTRYIDIYTCMETLFTFIYFLTWKYYLYLFTIYSYVELQK